MNRGTKNIIAIIIIVVMLICSYFTVDKINGSKIPNMNDNFKNTFNRSDDKSKGDEIEDSNTTNNTTSTNSVANKPSGSRGHRPSIPNRDNNETNDNNFNFDKDVFNSFNPVGRRSNNTLYIILFGLESAIIGGCAVYLVLLNTNKIKEKK